MLPFHPLMIKVYPKQHQCPYHYRKSVGTSKSKTQPFGSFLKSVSDIPFKYITQYSGQRQHRQQYHDKHRRFKHTFKRMPEVYVFHCRQKYRKPHQLIAGIYPVADKCKKPQTTHQNIFLKRILGAYHLYQKEDKRNPEHPPFMRIDICCFIQKQQQKLHEQSKIETDIAHQRNGLVSILRHKAQRDHRIFVNSPQYVISTRRFQKKVHPLFIACSHKGLLIYLADQLPVFIKHSYYALCGLLHFAVLEIGKIKKQTSAVMVYGLFVKQRFGICLKYLKLLFQKRNFVPESPFVQLDIHNAVRTSDSVFVHRSVNEYAFFYPAHRSCRIDYIFGISPDRKAKVSDNVRPVQSAPHTVIYVKRPVITYIRIKRIVSLHRYHIARTIGLLGIFSYLGIRGYGHFSVVFFTLRDHGLVHFGSYSVIPVNISYIFAPCGFKCSISGTGKPFVLLMDNADPLILPGIFIQYFACIVS